MAGKALTAIDRPCQKTRDPQQETEARSERVDAWPDVVEQAQRAERLGDDEII